MSTIERLKELEAKATPGPWHADVPDQRIVSEKGKVVDYAFHDADLELIAEMRNNIAKLLAVVEAFKALDLRCEVEDVLMDEPPCGDCEICRVNALMAEL